MISTKSKQGIQVSIDPIKDMQERYEQKHNDYESIQKTAQLREITAMKKRLFAIWDFNHDGAIDLNELLFGINFFCHKKGLRILKRDVLAIIERVDQNNDHELNQVEFSMFIERFSKFVTIPMLHVIFFLTVHLAEQRAERDTPLDEKLKELRENKEIENLWNNSNSTLDSYSSTETRQEKSRKKSRGDKKAGKKKPNKKKGIKSGAD